MNVKLLMPKLYLLDTIDKMRLLMNLGFISSNLIFAVIDFTIYILGNDRDAEYETWCLWGM